MHGGLSPGRDGAVMAGGREATDISDPSRQIAPVTRGALRSPH